MTKPQDHLQDWMEQPELRGGPLSCQMPKWSHVCICPSIFEEIQTCEEKVLCGNQFQSVTLRKKNVLTAPKIQEWPDSLRLFVSELGIGSHGTVEFRWGYNAADIRCELTFHHSKISWYSISNALDRNSCNSWRGSTFTCTWSALTRARTALRIHDVL